MADELRKVIPIDLNLTETNVFKNEAYQTNETFWTSDVNSAYLEFTTDAVITSGTASLVLKNIDDGSVVQRTIELSANTFEYMLSENEVKRAGRWFGQVVVNTNVTYLTATSFRFLIKGGMLDSSESALFDIDNYTKLSEQLVLLYDQMGVYVDDVTLSENERKLAEDERKLAEGIRSELFTDSQLAREVTFDTNESARQVEYTANTTAFETTLTELETFVNDGAVATRFDEKYNELEVNYAADLTNLKTSDESITSQLAQTNSQVDLLNRGLGETFATFTELETAYPTGDTKDHIVGANGHRYFWNETTWLDGGVYQAVEVSDKSISEEKTTFIKLSSNTFNINDITEGSVISSTGVVTSNATYAYSHDIKVRQNDKLTMYGVYFVAFYDDKGVFISRQGGGNSTTITLTVPTNAYKAVANMSITSDAYSQGIIQVNKGDVLLPFEEYYLSLNENITVNIPEITNDDLPKIFADKLDITEQSSNLININDITLGKVVGSTGTITSNAYYAYSHKILLSGFTEMAVFGIYYIAFYDESDVFMNRVGSFDGLPTIVTIPSNAKSAIMNFMTTSSKYTDGVLQVNEGSVLLPFKEYGSVIKSKYIQSNDESVSGFVFDSSLEGTFDSNRLFEDFTTNGWATNTSDNVYALIDNLQATYPNYITKQILRPDATGLGVAAYHLTPQRPQMTKEERYPTIFITSGTHGYERSSVINIYHMIKEMCEHWSEDETVEAIRFNTNIIWLPIVNPHGWTVGGGAAYQRTNSNGIDIARQFPDDWVLSDPTLTTYGGEAPLTEPEALNVKQVFDENPQIDVFYDCHNFGDVVDNYIWLATASNISERLGESLVKKMSRKWSKDFTFIPEDKLVGYTSIMNQGTIHNYAYKTRGIKRSGTFETNNQFHLDTTSIKYNQDSCKAGLEAITNFMLVNLRSLKNS